VTEDLTVLYYHLSCVLLNVWRRTTP